ncbi:MAG: hypothetical protein K6F58_02750, partial [Bacteroidales bacterium]|nr:hypothetical protein [Bacteroidales bacterium]
MAVRFFPTQGNYSPNTLQGNPRYTQRVADYVAKTPRFCRGVCKENGHICSTMHIRLQTFRKNPAAT